MDAPVPYGPFLTVGLADGVSLDLARSDGPIQPQHYAFLAGGEDFDRIHQRIRERGLSYWATRSTACST